MVGHRSCRVEPVTKPVDRAALSRATVVCLAVSGMGCPRCATRINNSLLRLEGVVDARVFLEPGVAMVAYDPALLSPNDLIQAVANAGNDGHHHYEARIVTWLSADQSSVPAP